MGHYVYPAWPIKKGTVRISNTANGPLHVYTIYQLRRLNTIGPTYSEFGIYIGPSQINGAGSYYKSIGS